MIDKVITWIKANVLITILIAFALVVVLFPKLLRGLFPKRRVKHRAGYVSRYRRRSVSPGRRRSRTNRGPLPRSVGMRKARPQYNKNGSRKKPWQIAGSLAARRHMAQIRKKR